jgi:hypothetical protein
LKLGKNVPVSSFNVKPSTDFIKDLEKIPNIHALKLVQFDYTKYFVSTNVTHLYHIQRDVHKNVCPKQLYLHFECYKESTFYTAMKFVHHAAQIVLPTESPTVNDTEKKDGVFF